jgi:hypothetical protein
MKAREPRPVASDSSTTLDWIPAKLSVEAAVTAVEELDGCVRDMKGGDRSEVHDLLSSCRLKLRSVSRDLARAKDANDEIEARAVP